MGLLGKIGQALLNPGKLFGTNFDLGEALTDITGESSSARQQYAYNKALQDDAQAFNAKQAQIERDWQTEMSNTARQRAVADLQSAGLNPVLAAGAEASSGAGAAATSPGASAGAGVPSANPISMIQAIVSTINSAKKTEAEVDKIKHEIKNVDADTKNKDADTKKKGQDYDLDEPNEETSKALKWWNSTWVGKMFNVAGDVVKNISPFIDTATRVSRANSTRRISKSQKFK